MTVDCLVDMLWKLADTVGCLDSAQDWACPICIQDICTWFLQLYTMQACIAWKRSMPLPIDVQAKVASNCNDKYLSDDNGESLHPVKLERREEKAMKGKPNVWQTYWKKCMPQQKRTSKRVKAKEVLTNEINLRQRFEAGTSDGVYFLVTPGTGDHWKVGKCLSPRAGPYEDMEVTNSGSLYHFIKLKRPCNSERDKRKPEVSSSQLNLRDKDGQGP